MQPDWRSPGFNENLIHGIIDWCVWSMLDVGGYRNISSSGASGLYGGNMANLRSVTDPNYSDGQVWESMRSNWVWESGINRTGVQPTVASGVYVTGVFYPTASTTGTYAHKINFPLGRIVFNNPISTGLAIKASYSYREVNFVQSKEIWFTELLYNSLNVQRTDFLASPGQGGAYEHLSQARRQMPAVGVELVNRRGSTPYEIGSLVQTVHQDVLFYILAENETDRNQISDILTGQNDKSLLLPDIAKMKADNRYPLDLDYAGSMVANPLCYPKIVTDFGTTLVRISNTSAQTMDTINSWLYRGVVRATFSAVI